MATILMRNLFSTVKTRLRFDLLMMRKVKLLANECAVDIGDADCEEFFKNV